MRFAESERRRVLRFIQSELSLYRAELREKAKEIEKGEFFKCEKCGGVGNWGNGAVCTPCERKTKADHKRYVRK